MKIPLAVIRRRVVTAGIRPLVKVLGKGEGTVASIIMATRNKGSYLDLTLAALERQVFPADIWEVVITDDASTDETPAVLNKYEQRERLRLVRRRSSKCRGRSGARNDALELAQGRILIFLDDDRLMGPDFLLRHLTHHLNGPSIVLGDIHRRIHTHVSPAIDPALWELTRLLRGESSREREKNPLKRILEPEDLDYPERLRPLVFAGDKDYRPVFDYFAHQGMKNPFPWVCFHTGNASIPRDQILAIGGFDEGFRVWNLDGDNLALENKDLAYRLHLAGLPFRFEPLAYTLHQLHPREIEKEADRTRNLRHFFDKYPNLNRTEVEPVLRGKTSVAEWLERQRRFASRPPLPRPAPAKERRILWCSRGRGVGHAARDVALLDDLIQVCPEAQVHLLSYGPAVPWLRTRGFAVQDIGDSAADSLRLRFEAFTRAVEEVQPNLMVSDEELLALPVARSAGVPIVYLTNWLLDEIQQPECGYAHYASRILFADLPGSFPVPPSLADRTEFCGPWVLDAAQPQEDWRTLLDAHGRPLVIITGGTAQHDFRGDAAFVANAVTAALSQPSSPKVVVMGGALTERLAAEALVPKDALLLDMVPNPVGLFRCADVVVTRAGHTTLWELAAAGVPAIAVPRPRERDPLVTDYARHMARLGSCLYVPEVIATPQNLQTAIYQVLQTPLGEKLVQAGKQVDFAARRRETVARLLDEAIGEHA